MGDFWYICDEIKAKYVTFCKENDTWLPTEEQLQNMVFAPTMERPVDLLSRFAKWAEHFRNYISDERKFSIKQLWLCYVMETIFNMSWSNGEWHKINMIRRM